MSQDSAQSRLGRRLLVLRLAGLGTAAAAAGAGQAALAAPPQAAAEAPQATADEAPAPTPVRIDADPHDAPGYGRRRSATDNNPGDAAGYGRGYAAPPLGHRQRPARRRRPRPRLAVTDDGAAGGGPASDGGDALPRRSGGDPRLGRRLLVLRLAGLGGVAAAAPACVPVPVPVAVPPPPMRGVRTPIPTTRRAPGAAAPSATRRGPGSRTAIRTMRRAPGAAPAGAPAAA